MGFGPVSIGFMLLFDLQTALSHESGGQVYAVIDIFPNVLGFILLFWGLFRLTKEDRAFLPLRNASLAMLFFSVFSLLKDTALCL